MIEKYKLTHNDRDPRNALGEEITGTLKEIGKRLKGYGISKVKDARDHGYRIETIKEHEQSHWKQD